MIPQSVIDDILTLDIADVLGRYMELKRKGANYGGRCPFHEEKTPSFMVSPSKGIFKCFGCGKGGNAIGFVMEMKKSEFPEAVREIAGAFGITIPQPEHSQEEEAAHRKREALYTVNKLVAGFFADNLAKDEKALAYARSRWNDETIAEFQIGYAPDSFDTLKKWAAANSVRQEILIEAGLLADSKGKVFDFFRGRVMFPIINRTGRITGFTGRDFTGSKEAPKYQNTRDTEIYAKSRSLYGINTAYRHAKDKGYMHLVEGNPDVMRLQSIGKFNTVGTCGTSLTADHIAELKKITNSVTIIGDSDENKAGEKAVIRSGKMIVEAGMFCNVVMLPVAGKEEKHDPDSFFTDGDQFDEYAKKHIQDYILWLADTRKEKAKSPDLKSRLINEISDLVMKMPESSRSIYVEKLGEMIKPKKAWQDAIRQIQQLDVQEEVTDSGIPSHVSLSDWENYGFYEDGNRYYFRTKNGPIRGSNFVMVPLFHIKSTSNAKRIFRVTNVSGVSDVIEFAQRDLISLASFRHQLESVDNYVFEGGDSELIKLKRYIYEKTDTCTEISQMGWQKQGFWAWSNGIFNGSFKVTDNEGIVKHDGKNYYLPSSSSIYMSDDNLFVSERRFKFVSGVITLHAYAGKLIEVFGDNAMFGICFYMAGLFRDHINRLFGFFPILNLFGPKGAGKTELAISLLQFFGHQSKGPNITNTTKAALADHVALFSNSLCHIDEYKNNLEYEKIEFLKGLWDGTGRTRMNMDKDKKKETTSVDCAIVLSGQEMPTADIALFSRLIFLAFTKVEYTDEEKAAFNNLKEIEKLGLSHITHLILSHRMHFITTYLDHYKEASADLMEEIGDVVIEDRIFRNWLVVIAAYRALKDMIELPWDYRTLIQKAKDMIVRQNSETKKSNELSIFWNIVEYLANNGEIREDVDFRIDCMDSIRTDMFKHEVQWSKTKNVLLMNHSRLFQLYRVHGKKAGENILPLKTLEYYLVNSKEYLGRKASVRFKVEENRRIVEDQELSPMNGQIDKKKTVHRVTTAMAFDYDKIGISIHNTVEIVDREEVNPDLPF